MTTAVSSTNLIAQRRRQVIELLRAEGPQQRAVILDRCEIPKGSAGLVFAHPIFARVDKNTWRLSDDKRAEAVPLGTNVPKAKRPENAFGEAAVGRVRDLIAVELVVREPQTASELAKRLGLPAGLIEKSLKSTRYYETPKGWLLK